MSDLPAGISYVRVTNGLDEKIIARHDGIDMVWKPGDSHDISVLAARHIFGFGLDDKRRAFMQLGWVKTTDDVEAAMEKMGHISFEEVEQVYRQSKPRRKALPAPVSATRVPSSMPGASEGEPSSPTGSPNDPDDDEVAEAEVI